MLIEKIKDVHCIGIRSKTKLTKKVLDAAEKLGVIGCFCIGTNQVDLEVAAQKGIAVFNSPFSNSRSVAELVLAEIVLLSRQLGDRNNEMHQGIWSKVSANCYEIRGKTLGKYFILLLSFRISVLIWLSFSLEIGAMPVLSHRRGKESSFFFVSGNE